MVTITIKTNFRDVQRQLDELHKDIAGPALVRAVNRSIEPARPEMAREIAREFNVTSSQARERLRINRASYKQGRFRIEASLEATGKRGRSMNLIHFVEKSVTFAAAKRRRKAGEGGTYQLRNGATVSKAFELRFKIKRGGPYKVIKGAFIANGGRTVFQREGQSRLPIKALQTIDIAQMFNTQRVNERVRKSLIERFPANFEREVKFYTNRFNARRAAASAPGADMSFGAGGVRITRSRA